MKRLIVLVALLSAGCASTPLKQNATLGLQTSMTALASAQDIERSLCFNAPATESGSHCTNALAATVGLTDARHVGMARYFEVAFVAESKSSVALLTWKSGDPAPSSVAEYQTDITAILNLTKQLLPGAQSLVDTVQTAVNEAAAIATIVGVK